MPGILSRNMHHFRRVPFVKRSVLVLLWLATCSCALSAQDIANEPRRETWQRVPDLFRAMGVHEGAIVADVGAGEGFLTVRLSPLVGNSGKVYAVDSDKSVADGVRQRVRDAQMMNVEIITGADDDPHLPRGLDAVIILNAYHEIRHGVTMLRHIHDALKPGAALVLCEPAPAAVGQTRAAQMDDHVLHPEIIVDDLQQAGFQIVDRQDTFATNLGGTHFGPIVARRP
jgi:predicted methyltransferase